MPDPAILKNKNSAQIEAFAQVVVLVAYADGDLNEAEESVLRDRLTLWCGSTIDPHRMEYFLTELPPLSRAENNWRAARIRELKKQLDDESLHKPAFALAVAVANADAKIGIRESRMLANMAIELDIDPAFAKEVLTNVGRAR